VHKNVENCVLSQGQIYGGVLQMLKHSLQNFTMNNVARKLLEAVVQMELHFLHMYRNEKICRKGKRNS